MSEESLSLDRMDGENRTAHRALILYAIQDADIRSFRAAASGVERSESTVRSWRDRWRWQERLEAAGAAVQTRALQVYRESYAYHYRGRDVIPAIQARMSVPILSDDPALPPPAALRKRKRKPPPDVRDPEDELRPPGAPPAPHGAVQGVRAPAADAEPSEAPTTHQGVEPTPLGRLPQTKALSERHLKMLTAYRQGLDGMLVGFLKEVNQGTVKLTPKEAILVARERTRVNDEILFLENTGTTPASPSTPGTLAGAPSGPVETTHRVRDAEKRGESVARAILADAEDLVAICRALAHAEEADARWTSPDEDPSRAADTREEQDDPGVAQEDRDEAEG